MDVTYMIFSESTISLFVCWTAEKGSHFSGKCRSHLLNTHLPSCRIPLDEQLLPGHLEMHGLRLQRG